MMIVMLNLTNVHKELQLINFRTRWCALNYNDVLGGELPACSGADEDAQYR